MIEADKIIFGTWGISGDFGVKPKSEILRTFDYAIDRGITTFDTAAVYGEGRSEDILGEIRNTKIKIATKIPALIRPNNKLVPTVREAYPEKLFMKSVETSIKRLKRECIDVLQLHNWHSSWDIDYILELFLKLRSQGKINRTGISVPNNMNSKLPEGIDVVQVPINLVEDWAIELLDQTTAEIWARSIFFHGALTGLLSRGESDPQDARKGKFTRETVDRIKRIIEGLSIDESRDKALKFIADQESVDSIIIGFRNKHQIDEILGRDGSEVTEDMIQKILKERGTLFPWTQSQIFFDNAGLPPTNGLSVAAGRHMSELEQEGYTGEYRRRRKAVEREARREIAELIGCKEYEIVLTQNTSEGINLVANGIEWKEGDEVIIENQKNAYPTNIMPWLEVKRKGVKVIEIGSGTGEIAPEDVDENLTEKTRIVALTSVNWTNGRRLPLREIGCKIKSKNPKCKFLLDGVQSVGMHRVDVNEMMIDYLAVGGQKWMLAGKGIGFLYCREDAQGEIVNKPIGNKSLLKPRDISSGLKSGAVSFNGGTQSPELIAKLEEAAALINIIGIEEIERRILDLSNYLIAGLELRKFEVTKHNLGLSAGIVQVKLNRNPSLTNTENPVWTAMRDGFCRISLHYYNTKEEIDEFLRRLEIS